MSDDGRVIAGICVFIAIICSLLLFIVNGAEKERVEKIAIIQEHMTEELNETLNLKEDDIEFIAVLEDQLYKAVVKENVYEIYLNEERKVISIVAVGTVLSQKE